MSKIKKYFPNMKAMHVRVDCNFLEVSRAQEGELILDLHSINGVFVPHTLAHDIFMMQNFGLSNKETLLRHLPAEGRSWIESEMKRERRGAGHKDEFMRMVEDGTSRIDRESLSLHECQLQYDAIVKAVENTLTNRGYNLAAIAHPANGQGFFYIIYNLDWSLKGLVVNEDKLQFIASSNIGPAKKKEVVSCLACDKQQRDALGIPADNKNFRRYIAKETYWWQMIEMAKRIVARLSTEEANSSLPDGDEIFLRSSEQITSISLFQTYKKT